MIRRIPHQLYYVIELLVLLAGFFIIFLLSYSFRLQALALVIILAAYTVLGIIHHKVHHALRAKIVVEYVLVSLVIWAVFLFLNIGKL